MKSSLAVSFALVALVVSLKLSEELSELHTLTHEEDFSPFCGYAVSSRRLQQSLRYPPYILRALRAVDNSIQDLHEDQTCPVPIVPDISGFANNAHHPGWGCAGALMRRSANARSNLDLVLPHPRMVSNTLGRGNNEVNKSDLTNFVWLWGQFIDHDITRVGEAEPKAHIDLLTNEGGPNDPFPGHRIPFGRSKFVPSVDGTPRHRNEISSFIDASTVYGSRPELAMELRRKDGTGKLRSSLDIDSKELLPFASDEFPVLTARGVEQKTLFLAGDTRVNEQTLLTAMHTVFMREHNRQCDLVVRANAHLQGNDAAIYDRARAKVMAHVQAITVNEFLPSLLGDFECPPYNHEVDPTISMEFATAAFRVGHTMVTSTLKLAGPKKGSMALKDAFFQPQWIIENGIEGLLKGAEEQKMNAVDIKVVPDLLDFLFGAPVNRTLMDLFAINVQRAREVKLPSYVQMREVFGLTVPTNFAELEVSEADRAGLASVYYSVNEIDAWVGCLCEKPMAGKQVGPLLAAALTDQFQRLCSGDRYWFTHSKYFSKKEIEEFQNTKLGHILERNTGWPFRDDVFKMGN